MFRIFYAVSTLSRRLCCGNIQYYRLALDRKYMIFLRNVFTETSTCMQISNSGCRLYAKKHLQPDLEVQTEDIWKQLCHSNRLPILDVQNCKEIIKYLLSFHYRKNYIICELSENTVLLKFPVSRWKETVSILQSYGFHEAQYLPLLIGCHLLLQGTAWNNLHEMLTFLHSLHIPYRRRLQIITRNPAILLTDDTGPVLQNYGNLLKCFTKNEAQTLVVKNPNLLTDPVEETNEKINYVYYKMGIRSKEMTESQVFEHPLIHIITRHRFAERAGIYKFPNKHEMASKELNLRTVLSANPSVSDLVDTSNASFVHSFCSMTVPEYEAFAAMMMEELCEQTEDETDSDFSDSDSE